MSPATAKKADRTDAEMQLVCFILEGDLYAVDIMRIKEIVPYQKIRPVPRAPKYVQGVINLRGAVLPVVDLRHRFSLPNLRDLDTGRRILITSLSGRIVGLVVDAVTEILKLGAESIVRVPSLINRRETAYVYGVAITEDDMVLVLNLDRVLTSEEHIDMDRVRRAALEGAGLAEESGTVSPEDDAQAIAEALLGGFIAGEEGPRPAGPEKTAEAPAVTSTDTTSPPADGAGGKAEAGEAEKGVSITRALSKRKKSKKKTSKERGR